ncbi:MAG: diguanylate cyclase, partial [Nitrospira sp.]|nr:diguanylate cyclase [Nitrospira sp.]
IQQPFILNSHTLNVTIWIGIALFPQNSEDPDTLAHQAYKAMEMAKQSGNGYAVYRPEDEGK